MAPAHNAKPRAGSYWLVESDEHLWPAVIVTDDMVPQKVLAKRPGGYPLPVLLMLKLSFKWVYHNDLIEFEPSNQVHLSRQAGTEELCRAYEAIEDCGWADLDWWRSILLAKDINESNGPSGLSSQSGSDPHLSQAKRTLSPETRSNESLSVRLSKRRRVASPSPCRWSDSEDDDEAGMYLPPIKKEEEIQTDEISPMPPNEPMATIYIGKARVPFQVPYNSLTSRLHLLELKVWHPKQGWTISRPLFDTINPEHFRPVAEYLNRGDYAPDLIGRDTGAAHLTGIITKAQKAAELIRCGVVFNIARDIQLSDLIELVVEKMKLLRPWPPLEVITVSNWVLTDASTGFEADDELRNLLEEHVADNFWELVQTQTSNLCRIMKEHSGFEAAVMVRVADNAKVKSLAE